MINNISNKDLFKIILKLNMSRTTFLIKICHQKEEIMKFYKEILIKIIFLNKLKINKKD